MIPWYSDRMTQPTTTLPSDKDTRTANAQRVEAHLRELQNANRLAVHMMERKDATFMSSNEALQNLESNESEDIKTTLGKGESKLFSSTYIPSEKTKVRVGLYRVEPHYMNTFGYMMDLSQEQNNPPQVLRVSPWDLFSDSDTLNKGLRFAEFDKAVGDTFLGFERISNLPAQDKEQIFATLKGYYEAFKPKKIKETDTRYLDAWEQQFMLALAADKKGNFSKTQLALLDDIYTNLGKNADAQDAKFELNEILLSCTSKHIAAIVVLPEAAGIKEADMAKLQGALVGLEHLDSGVDKPVVMYDVDAPQTYTYIGQGRAELSLAAIEALNALGVDGVKRMKAALPRDIHGSQSEKDFAQLLMDKLKIDTTGKDWELQFAKRMDELSAQHGIQQPVSRQHEGLAWEHLAPLANLRWM